MYCTVKEIIRDVLDTDVPDSECVFAVVLTRGDVRVVCGLCRASILAGLAGMQGYASPLRSPGPSFPSAVIFRSFTRSDFAVSPSNSRQPCASGCGFPCALCIPTLSPGFYGGTAPPGVAEYVNNGGKHHAICETCHSER
ncbi:Uncharacterised protein [Shigella sonnei]|nr:antirestriction protein [Shigella sonnei]CTE27461.1 Uncharacterised protein [Shigella sonnei]